MLTRISETKYQKWTRSTERLAPALWMLTRKPMAGFMSIFRCSSCGNGLPLITIPACRSTSSVPATFQRTPVLCGCEKKIRAKKSLFSVAEGSNLRVIARQPDYIGSMRYTAHFGQNLMYWFFNPVRAAVKATDKTKNVSSFGARISIRKWHNNTHSQHDPIQSCLLLVAP